MKSLHSLLLLLFVLNCLEMPLQAGSIPVQLVSTESDPDAFIQHCVNVINGDYCESCTDLVVAGPDTLLLQRFYNAKNYITGSNQGGWRIFPQRLLVLGKDPKVHSKKNGEEPLLAFTGERSGGILPYCGWRTSPKEVREPLKIEGENQALGMVNTFSKEISGQNNHCNNRLYYRNKTCELVLGDGSKRIYHKVNKLPDAIFGEELTPAMMLQVDAPECYLLSQENLPSGNQIHFSYDKEGHLTSIEMRNVFNKLLSWIHLTYNFNNETCCVHVDSSDAKTITYHFELKNDSYQLLTVKGSHLIPVSYMYRTALVKKILPEGRFVEIEYQNEKVKTLKGPHALSGAPEIVSSFTYQDRVTEVTNILGIKTRYHYDKRLQLTAIERYDSENHLYRNRASANAKFLMICHSQGAIHVRNALLDYPPHLRERILVVAIAPAAYIYVEAWRDPIPRIDVRGAMRSRNSIVDLKSDSSAPLFNHEFRNATYEGKLERHIIKYIESKGRNL